MILAVEICLAEPVGDLVQRIGRQHQATKHRLLGVDGVRRDTDAHFAGLGHANDGVHFGSP